MSDKSSINGVLKKGSEKLSNNTIGVFKPIITSAIETIRGKSKRPDIDSEKRINIFQGKEKSEIEILQQNMTFLQIELLSKNEIIKLLMKMQSSVLNQCQSFVKSQIGMGVLL